MPLDPSLPEGTTMMPADAFAGKVVYITGSGAGVGRAIAVEFARCGAVIAVAGSDADKCAATVRAVEDAGGRASATSVEVSDADNVAASFHEVEGALGPISILINNYEQVPELPAELMPPSEWRRITDTVLDGSFFCARELANRRIADKGSASIINFSSPYTVTGGAGTAHMEAAKAALENLTKSLAIEWAPDNIRVNGIAPGYLAPEAGAPSKEAEAAELLGATVPARRTCSPHEVAWCALYICSPFAAYLTGHTLVVDGASWQRPGRLPPLFEPIRERYERRQNNGA